MATKKPAATAFRKKPAAKSLVKGAPAQMYAPSAAFGNTFAAVQSAIQDGQPLFYPMLHTPRMLRDPVVNFGIWQRIAPMKLVRWDIQSPSREVAEFVENTVKRFWRHSMPLLAKNYFVHGYAPGIHRYAEGADGAVRYAKCQWVTPTDATPLRHADGERKGQFGAFDLTSGAPDDEHGSRVLLPWAAWYAGLEQQGQFYDHPPIAGAFVPWLEKNTKCGALHSRKLYFRTSAFRGQVIYHPDGFLDPQDPASGRNRDFALYLLDSLENGSGIAFADNRVPGDGRTDPTWRIEPIEGNQGAAVDIMEYIAGVDTEILVGLGIPPEVVEAAETGSGFSGRQIPFMTLLNTTDLLVGPMVGVIEPAVREMVSRNYDGAEFTLDTEPLADTVRALNDPKTTFQGDMGGGDPAEATQSPDAAMAGSGGGDATGGGVPPQDPAAGGGDPTGGGLVPYVGRRGGKGKKDPVSGRVYYLSHAGRRVGCLMADIPDPLRSAVLAFGRTIPREHLADDGLELDPHVTLFHGLEAFDSAGVFAAVAPLGTLAFVPGELRVFEGDGHDVLYVSCDDERKWHTYHRAASHLPGEATHDTYIPHLTLAYLKRGKGKHYAGKTPFGSEPSLVETLTYAAPDGRESKAAVWPSEAELADAFRGTVELAWHADRSERGTLKAVWDGEGGIDKKPQYGENARRALAGDALLARRPGQDNVIAEKVVDRGVARPLPTAPRVQPKTATEVPLNPVGPAERRTRPDTTSTQRQFAPPTPVKAKPKTPPPAPVKARAKVVTPPPPQPPTPPLPTPKPAPRKSAPRPAPKPPADDAAWEDEYRALQNRHDVGDAPLRPAELVRLWELQKLAGVPERLRVKLG